ncbi:MAG TPA: glycosyltransferase family A protein, partial [Actinoplanes sp.]|nr:glycosyltransferase family A protein [Actinoplanes sp.]
MTGQDPLAVTALRAGSVEARDPLARAAGDDPWRLGELARVIALQDLRPGDRAEALALLARIGRLAPEHHGLYAQLALAAGDRALAAALATACPEPIRTALTVDLANPFTGSPDAAFSESCGSPRRPQAQAPGAALRWGFADLLPSPAVRVADGPGAPFDRLETGWAQRVGHRARITTIVTTYQPGPELLTAVRSLAAQTWTNHEILVVDDGSPHGHDDVLRRAIAIDPRARLIRLPANGGTYVARNAGLDAATGEYVTFQDSDDWSHPLRLERQVAPLLADPAVFCTTSTGMRVTDDLRVSRPGFPQTRSYNLSSLMVRREVALRRLGHLDPVRKGADAEYVERARAVFGRPATRHLDGPPLALIRLSSASLSSADYRPGWMHPARRSYLSAFRAWHRQVAAGAADPRAAGARDSRAFAAPRRMLGRTGRRIYDVVLAADWTSGDGGLGRVRALQSRGLRVAVLHLDDPAHLRHRLGNLDAEVQDAI